VNLALQVQGGSVIVDVTGEAPMSNTQDATLGNNFNSRQLTDLPSEGRGADSILRLQAGVVYIGKATNNQHDNDSRGGAMMVHAATRPTLPLTGWTITTS
jgi:hypothetical protein